MYTREALQGKIDQLTENIAVLDGNLTRLAKLVSSLQLRAWRKNRATLNTQLQKVKAKYKSLYQQKNNPYPL